MRRIFRRQKFKNTKEEIKSIEKSNNPAKEIYLQWCRVKNDD